MPAPLPSPERRAEAIVADVLRRRRKGERVQSDRVLQAYPDLRACLEPLLRKADVLAAAWSEPPTDSPPYPLQELLQRMDDDPELPPLSDSSLHSPPRGEGENRATIREEDVAENIALPVEVCAAQVRRPHVHVAPRQIDQPQLEANAEPQLATPVAPTAPYRPSMRPPIAMLRILDDDQQRGETVRIRKAEFVIGREQGDLTIPHDMQISARHAAILRIDTSKGTTWHLHDLRAANGVFVRVKRIDLRGGERFLLANSLVRFVPATGSNPNRLEELTPQGISDTLPLVRSEHWIGRDSQFCERFLQRNPMIDPRMACIACDHDGQWSIRCLESLNGMWERVGKSELKSGSMFQLGEQRFVFEVG